MNENDDRSDKQLCEIGKPETPLMDEVLESYEYYFDREEIEYQTMHMEEPQMMTTRSAEFKECVVEMLWYAQNPEEIFWSSHPASWDYNSGSANARALTSRLLYGYHEGPSLMSHKPTRDDVREGRALEKLCEDFDVRVQNMMLMNRQLKRFGRGEHPRMGVRDLETPDHNNRPPQTCCPDCGAWSWTECDESWTNGGRGDWAEITPFTSACSECDYHHHENRVTDSGI